MKNPISILALLFVIAVALGCGTGNDRSATETSRTPGNQSNAPQKPQNSEPVSNTAGAANEETNQATSAEKPIRSTDLIEAFKQDEAAANAKYKDQVILISGKITNINDVFGVKALNLRESENDPGLQTYLKNSADVERVKVGDRIVVRGKVRGDGIDVVDDAVIIKVN